MPKLERIWEKEHDTFEQVTKAEFDKLLRDDEFIGDPLSSKPSKWAHEFGPYNPERWAFGILKDGRRICFRTDQDSETPP